MSPTFRKGTKEYPSQWVEIGDGIGVDQTADGKPKLVGIHIKDLQQEGGIGDGVFDNTAIAQAAIDVLGAAGGGVLYIPVGNWLCSQLRLKTRVQIWGAGQRTQLHQKANTTGHHIILDNGSVEFTTIQNIMLVGNKANQTAVNHGIYYNNAGGSFSIGDSHHMLSHVLITSYKGSGLCIGPNVRELRAFHLIGRDCDRYGMETEAAGGTDNFFCMCTWQGNGLSGANCNGYGNRHVGDKAFGNGVLMTSGNGSGFLISGLKTQMAGCEAQENWGTGAHLLNVHSCNLELHCDANGDTGILIDNSFDNLIHGIILSTTGLVYQTIWALRFLNASDRNHVEVVARATEFSAGILPDTTDLRDNWIRLNNRWYGRLYVVGRNIGNDDEQIAFGKRGSPATNNPEYVWKTDASNPPIAHFSGWDNVESRTMISVDYGNNYLYLGQKRVSSPFGEIITRPGTLRPDTDGGTQVGDDTRRFANTFIKGRVDAKFGTAGSTTDEFLRLGKVGSPATSNPYFTWVIDSSSVPRTIIQSWDGTTGRNYATFNHTDHTTLLEGKVGISTNPGARLQVLNNGNMGDGGITEFGIAAYAESGQATLGAYTNLDSPANLCLTTVESGTRKSWINSKRGSGDSNRLSWYWHDGTTLSLRARLETNGDLHIDGTYQTFSPTPPKPWSQMTPRDCLDWALEDANKPEKPYAGIPDVLNPEVIRLAAEQLLSAEQVVASEQTKYGKDISKIAIGIAHWAKATQARMERLDQAIRDGTSWDAFKAAWMAP